MGADSPGVDFSVLFVCTGNICRSAVAERVARAYLREALAEDAATISVGSAGTQAAVGSGVHPNSALVMAGFGGDPSGFSARQLREELAAPADLVLGLTRAHRRVALQMAPRALSRTFTLREASDLARVVDAGAGMGGVTYADRCRAFVAAMAGARSNRSSGDGDDIGDPIGRPLEVHQEVGEEIVQALLPLLGRLVSLRTAGGVDGASSPSLAR